MEHIDKDHINGKDLGHLGLLAGMVKKVRLVERIDKFLPVSKEKGAVVTMGERVAAMIFNALGFIDTRLYMFSDFLSNKPVNKLINPNLQAEHFTDDALGRCLDAIYEFGPTKLFSHLTFSIASHLELLGKSIHIDTTSLSVYGQYDDEGEDPLAPKVTYGFSKDKRHDLKQLVLNLATNNKADLPIHMAAHSGNASDHKTLIQAAARIEQFCSQLAEMPSFIYVADSAMYESCLKEGKKLMWLSRVPMQRKEAKRFIWDRKDHVQDVVGTEYQIHAEEKVVAGIKQRWLLVFSKQAYNRAVSTIEKNKAKEQVTASKKLRYLSKQVYNCQKDAEKTLKKFQKELKYHCITEIAFNAKKKYQNKGRPKEEDEMVAVGYQIKGVLVEDNTKIASLLTQKGYFILSTNQLDKNELSDEAILWEYKAQQKTERGFAFIKDNTFEVSSVFLKKPSRISALMMVMALSLFIYSLTQYWLRRALVDKHEFIPNQLKKPTQKPTAKWVFFLLRSIHVIYIRGPGHNQELVINLNPLLKRIIKYFGQETMSIYDIIPSTVE